MTAASDSRPDVEPLPVPAYGERSLADLLPSMLATLDVGDQPGPLALPPASRVCLLLVDGLGLGLLRAHPDEAPFLASLLHSSAAVGLTAVFPATTSASLTSIGTGRTPGEHGLVGFEMYLPEFGQVLNCLTWDPAVPAATLQPEPTAFERACAAGVAVSRVGPRRFDGSGLTEAGMRGGSYMGAETAGERVAVTADALTRGRRSLVYVYYGDLDATGHRDGCGSAAWRYQLGQADVFAEQLASALPGDSLLLVTADHGMVDVPPDARWDVAIEPELDAGVRLLAGEPRAVYVHAVPGALADVLAAWRETLGPSAWVLERDEAVAAGLFGPVVRPHVLPRIGDVVVVARDPVAVVDSRRSSPQARALVGMHGSLTDAELLVPLLMVRG